MRIKRGVTARNRHKKILKLAKGYRGRRKSVYRLAKQAVIRAGQYSYRDRRNKKRVFRRLWITRINAAARLNGISYSQLINRFKVANITVDRKQLSFIAATEPRAFAQLVEQALKGSTSQDKTNKTK